MLRLDRAGRLFSRRGVGAVGGVASAALLPYLVAGPGLFLDDWFALRNAQLDGWWHAAGADQWQARPGAGLVYAATFGLIGAHPLALAALAAALLAVTAMLLFVVVRRIWNDQVALAVSASWLIIANHTSLEAWPSALNIVVALLLAVLGVERVTRADPTWRTDGVATVCFSASVLSYEATGPAVVALVLAMAFRRRREGPPIQRLLVTNGVALGGAAGWMITHWHPAKQGIEVWFSPLQMVDAHLGAGVVGDHVGGALLGALALGISVLALYERVAHSGEAVRSPAAVQLLAVGWALIVAGTVPFVRYFYSPVGLGDRVTVVSGIGGALVLIGGSIWLLDRHRRAAIVLLSVVLVGAVGNRASIVRDYAVAADDGRRILDHVQHRWPDPPEHPIVFGPYPVVKRNVVAFIDADWPLQWLYRSREIDGRFTVTSEQFEEFPADWRVDLVELSKLEPLGRI